MDDRTSDSSVLSTDRANFRQRMADRDGTCLMTGSTNFQACHIVPHAKGDQYMSNLTNHRHEVLEPPLNDINDTRNGILLAVQLHGPFGASEVAFLPQFRDDRHFNPMPIVSACLDRLPLCCLTAWSRVTHHLSSCRPPTRPTQALMQLTNPCHPADYRRDVALAFEDRFVAHAVPISRFGSGSLLRRTSRPIVKNVCAI
ncbi:hypothetical protein F5887DRAFT_56124 [Amanita rubescens]|nr:hypothetical protein F5887DRAFT_56124 [Amanita rubescens]